MSRDVTTCVSILKAEIIHSRVCVRFEKISLIPDVYIFTGTAWPLQVFRKKLG